MDLITPKGEFDNIKMLCLHYNIRRGIVSKNIILNDQFTL